MRRDYDVLKRYYLNTLQSLNECLHEEARLRRQRSTLSRLQADRLRRLRAALRMIRSLEVDLVNQQCATLQATKLARHHQEVAEHRLQALEAERRVHMREVADLEASLREARAEASLHAQLTREMAA